MKIEKRTYQLGDEFRTAIQDSRHVSGYGSVFNLRSVDMGGWYEIIDPGAFDGVIERSNVIATLEHDRKKVFARSKRGNGSLSLSVDERGLKYEFDVPNTTLGNDTLELMRSGVYDSSSFAFTVEHDYVVRDENNVPVRHIDKIAQLYDVAIVADPAYPDASVGLRSVEAFLEDEARKEAEEIEARAAEEEKEEEEKPEDEKEADPEEEIDDENDPESEDEDKEKENRNKSIKKMEKFSLLKTIRSIVNNTPIDEVNQYVLNAGREEMRKSGLAYSGQIQVPLEMRADGDEAAPVVDPVAQATVTGAGEEIVATEKFNILAPLRNKLVFTQLGANYMTGLVGNISIPKYSGTTAGWAGEIEEAENGLGTFTSCELAPKRITAFIDISKQFIAQDSVGAENMLHNDIVTAVAQVLESTILGNAAGDTKKPAGIFNGAEAANLTFAGLVDMEKTLETANIPGNYKFVVSPSIKATLKTTTVGGTKSDIRMLLEGGEANGYPVISTGNAKGIALANWEDLIIGQWSALDITVDPYTVSTKGCVRLVVNAYFDAAWRHEEAVVAKA